MAYFQWYFADYFPLKLTLSRNLLRFISYYFGFKILTHTLFSPWKKQVVAQSSKGFSPQTYFHNLSFNLISRMIGFSVRTLTLIAGVVIYLLATIFLGIYLLLFLIFCPFFYLKYRSANRQTLPYNTQNPTAYYDALLNGDVAVFFCQHTQISHDQLKAALTPMSTLTPKANSSPIAAFRQLFLDFPALQKLLSVNQLDLTDLDRLLKWYQNTTIPPWWGLDNLLSTPTPVTNWSSGYTPTLDHLCQDLSREDLSHYRCLHRENDFQKITTELSRSHEPNIIVIGEPGSGKSTLIHGLAKQIQMHLLPTLNHKRILLFNSHAFLSLTSTRNASDILHQLFDEAKAADNIIICFPNFHELFVTQTDQINLSVAFDESLNTNLIQLIGLTTPTDFHTYIKPQETIMKVFSTMEIHPFTSDQTLDLLTELARDFETQDHLTITYQVLKTITLLTDKFITNVPFPEKALDIFDELVAQSRNQANPIISVSQVEAFFETKYGIPVSTANQTEADKLLHLESQLRQRIVGQELAISAIAKALRLSRSGIKNNRKPIGSFLFLGPTGVGKTETAKVVSEIYFQHQNIITLNMAEFQTPDSIEHLIGSHATSQPGLLTKQIESNPFSLLLLDEFEKAPLEVHNLFLSIIDEGFFNDHLGKKISCSNLILIATSNAGSEALREYLQTNPPGENLNSHMTEFLLQNHLFSPELLNRFDALVYYRPLNETDIRQVLGYELHKLQIQLLHEKQITLKISPQTVNEIIANGYDPQFGARSIIHCLQNTLEDQIATQILSQPDIKLISL